MHDQLRSGPPMWHQPAPHRRFRRQLHQPKPPHHGKQHRLGHASDGPSQRLPQTREPLRSRPYPPGQARPYPIRHRRIAPYRQCCWLSSGTCGIGTCGIDVACRSPALRMHHPAVRRHCHQLGFRNLREPPSPLAHRRQFDRRREPWSFPSTPPSRYCHPW